MKSEVNVVLMAHTRLSDEFQAMLTSDIYDDYVNRKVTDGQLVSMTAIRTCYSHLNSSDIVNTEFERYFNTAASDGMGGTDADRLFRQIIASSHTSTLEHTNFTLCIEGVSRSLLAQITRHRHFSFSVQSQRYVKMASTDKIGGFDYVVPPKVKDNDVANSIYVLFMHNAQVAYDMLRENKIPSEDARLVLPNAATTNMVVTANLRSLLEFYKKRKHGEGAQWEIANLAEILKEKVIDVEPWTEKFFG